MVWCGKDINQVGRYFTQLIKQTYPFAKLDILAMEGNSKDNTLEALNQYASMYKNVQVFTQENQFDRVTSTEDDGRIQGLSKIADTLITEALKIEDLDWVLWVESDLIFDTALVKDLLFESSHYTERNCIIAPMIYLQGHNVFYDTWGFRELDGTRWTEKHREKVRIANPLKEMSSVGSCALIDADLLRCGVRFGQGAFVELCDRARKLGGHVYADTNLKIWHPGQINLRRRWV